MAMQNLNANKISNIIPVGETDFANFSVPLALPC